MSAIDTLREKFSELEVDALLVTQPANVRYLSGFKTPEDGRVLITEDFAVLITDGRYIAQAAEESRLNVEIAEQNWLEDVAERIGERRVALESDHVTHALFNKMAEKLAREPAPSEGLVGELRLRKTPQEIETLRQAARVTDEAYSHILNFIGAGQQELEVALELERFMRRAGAETKSFEIIVASGVRSAMPHGVASQKVIERGDLVTLDFGARVDGYHADMTRAVAIGEIGGELRTMFDTVLEAQETALHALAPGKDGRDIDALAREVLSAKNLEEHFPHGLGHGVGLQIHEGPRLSKRVSQTLEPGMAVTVEPGVYIPDKGGVRIEDLAVITEGGYERLSHSDKSFVQI